MNSATHGNTQETSFLLVNALRTCRKKATRRNYIGSTLTPEERTHFDNCLMKYLHVTDSEITGLRAGVLSTI
jgi:hypothetical protein